MGRGPRLDNEPESAAHARVVQALDLLAEEGPGLGRPLVDTIHGSSLANLKELRPGTVRILFAFDPWRSSILLVAGDKAGRVESVVCRGDPAGRATQVWRRAAGWLAEGAAIADRSSGAVELSSGRDQSARPRAVRG
jgi:hypothetical protein